MEQQNNVASRKLLLLRTLGISETAIESLQNGTAELGDVMKARIAESTADERDVTQCAIVCQNIKMDGASYEELDPEPYLERIASMKATGGMFADDPRYIARDQLSEINKPVSDPTPGSSEPGGFTSDPSEPFRSSPIGPASVAGAKPIIVSIFPHPVIRGLARFVDMMIYILIANLLFRFVLKTEPVTITALTSSGVGAIAIWWQFLIYVMMFTLEPVMLHLFGTTPGKLIFGLKLYAGDGSKLTWKQAFTRSFRLFRFGFGFCIPFYSFIRICVSLIACSRRQPLAWDLEIRYTAPQKKRVYAIPLVILVIMLISTIDTLSSSIAEIPKNDLPLTVEQFEENCAHVVQYDSIVFSDVPDYSIEYDGSGHVKSVSYEVSLSNEEYIYEKYYAMFVAFLAFVGPSPEADLVSLNPTIVHTLFDNCFAEYSIDYAGFRISNTVEMIGYSRNVLQNYLYRSADSDVHTYHQVFTITLK